jgi:uracil-DNA glycosylase
MRIATGRLHTYCSGTIYSNAMPESEARMPTEFASNIVTRATAVRETARMHPIVGRFVDIARPIPGPFMGTGGIRLVIIGQDPTVERTESRNKVTMVLNLNRGPNLRAYLVNLCQDLGLDLDQHVYATNACKCFFTDRPKIIVERDKVDVLAETAYLWLPLLMDELAHFPDAFIISLGQPVLAMLTRPEHWRPMGAYWGYNPRWREGIHLPMYAMTAEESTIGRCIFPVVHESMRRGRSNAFYRERWRAYIAFIREASGL